MKKLIIIIPILVLCGCSNLMVPKGRIEGNIAGQPFRIITPKDTTIKGLAITVEPDRVGNWLGGPGPEYTGTNVLRGAVSIQIQELVTKMNPEVVSMSGEVFVNSVNAISAAVQQAVATGAATAATGGIKK